MLSEYFRLQLTKIQRELTFCLTLHAYVKSQQMYFKFLSISKSIKLQKFKAVVSNQLFKQADKMMQKISQIIRSHHFKEQDESILFKCNLFVRYKNILGFYFTGLLVLLKQFFFQNSNLQNHYYKILQRIVQNNFKESLSKTLSQKTKTDILQTCKMESYLEKHTKYKKQRFFDKFADEQVPIIKQERCLKLFEKLPHLDKYDINQTYSQVDVQFHQVELSFQKQHRLQATNTLNSIPIYNNKRQTKNNVSSKQSNNMEMLQQIVETTNSMQKVEMLKQGTQISFCQCSFIKRNSLIRQNSQISQPQIWNHQPIVDLQQKQIYFKQGLQKIQAKIKLSQQSINQQLSKIQKVIKIKYTIRDYARCVGVIKCAWYNRRGMMELLSFSTAFAISEWIVVTCGHTIYDKKRDRHCDKIQFIPFTGATRYSTKQDVYQSRDEDFIRFQQLQKQQKYNLKPLRKDYAVFILKRPFKNNCYLQLYDEPLRNEQKLEILGYPCRDYNGSTQAVGTFFKRMDLRGQLNRVKEGYILEHNMDTQSGHSGSPILRIQNQNNEQSIKVVGIHTHKGYGFMNEGLLMTRTLKDKIQSFYKQLKAKHKIQERSVSKYHKQFQACIDALDKSYNPQLQQQQSRSMIR